MYIAWTCKRAILNLQPIKAIYFDNGIIFHENMRTYQWENDQDEPKIQYLEDQDNNVELSELSKRYGAPPQHSSLLPFFLSNNTWLYSFEQKIYLEFGDLFEWDTCDEEEKKKRRNSNSIWTTSN
jgi:hypothetical protein